MITSAKMQPSYELQQEVEDADFLQHRQEEKAFRRFILKRHVVTFTSAVSARMVSGVSRNGRDKDASGIKNFLQNPGNRAKVDSFMQATNLSGDSNTFADVLDGNYDSRNDDLHNTTDAFLEESAAQLKRMGAVRLLREEMPWQCALIEHFEYVKNHLFA
ncbi:hypothetical protein Agub_g642 [Astrephomene gubernaculifera]|uniref:Uncharacterized protein n=1 Tax=Astrephomene gubernaculifera TaxID=47775 RepID=A0AAD3DE09_9CHLO|nr:hypothetical protein Agub_g642 [Astrephomene gubernaculifera]